MSVRQQIPYDCGTFFITITNIRWLKLFELIPAYDVVYEMFNYLSSKGHFVNAYVIMPNHLHAIFSFRRSDQSINTLIGNCKRFMALKIISKLKTRGDKAMLSELQSPVQDKERAKGQKHKVFQPSFDWKLCESEWFIEQKLNYIHNNPTAKSEPLCLRAIDFKHSSARQYARLKNYKYEVKLVYEMQDINLEK